MPRRITKAFFATAAAGATITTLGLAASPAGAGVKYFTPTGGTPIPTSANCTLSSPPAPSDNCGMAGYQASGRNFRFAQALITVPNHAAVVDSDSALPPAGTLVVQPSYLWNDGTSFHGRFGDAFGVWRFPF